MTSIHTAFFGSSSYVLPILDALRTQTKLKLVITQADKPVGRKQELTPSPPKIWAREHRLPVITPTDLMLEKDKVVDLMRRDGIELAVVADYGLLIPKEIFDLPKWKTINIHFSRLPDLRGPSPVQWTILGGDQEAWISFFLLAEELDAGPILFQKGVPLLWVKTTGQLYQALFVTAGQLLPGILNSYIQGSLKPLPQNHSQATFTRRLTRDDGFVPWEILQSAMRGQASKLWKPSIPLTTYYLLPATSIERMLRAFTPWPGLWTMIENRKQETGSRRWRLKIIKAHIDKEKLVLDEVQMEGKKPVHWQEFRQSLPV